MAANGGHQPILSTPGAIAGLALWTLAVGAALFVLPMHAKKRSITHLRAWTAKPIWPFRLRTISILIGLAVATRSPA